MTDKNVFPCYRRLFLDETLEMRTDLACKEQGEVLDNTDDAVLNKDFPQMIEMDWCIYNLNDSRVEADQTVFVLQPGKISAKTVEATGVTNEKLDKDGVPFQQAIDMFEESIKKLVLEGKRFKIITFGEWQVEYKLKIESKQKGT